MWGWNQAANVHPLSLVKPVATNVSNIINYLTHCLKSQRASGRDLQFSPNQTWLRTAKSFNFVDETQEVVNIYETSSSGNEVESDKDYDGTAQIASPSEGSSCHSYPGVGPNPSSQPDDFENSHLSPAEWAPSLCSPTAEDLSIHNQVAGSIPMQHLATGQRNKEANEADLPSPAQDGNLGFQALLSASHLLDYSGVSGGDMAMPVEARNDTQWPAPSHVTQPTWPLKDKQEAQLFCHFVRDIAPLFDLCDHERHFATVVPQRATTCPPLLNAILASSAKHSSRLGLVDPLVADRYYQDSLRTIIPMLSGRGAAVRDEDLLAAIVILRFIEEVDIPFSPADPQSHLIGTRAVLAARDRTRGFSKLGRAVFWLALRQEIWVALVHSRSVHPDMLAEDIVALLEGPPGCDCDYANRVIVQGALCLRYCFGGPQGVRSPSWGDLSGALDRWFAERPWQFYPMSAAAEEDEDQFLPEIKYLTDAVVTGSQHYYLARLILEAHNPMTIKLGPSRKIHLNDIDRKMRRLVRIICGIAKSNPHTVPAYVNASASIVLAGDRFTARHEQEILYNILVKTGKDLYWPTLSAQQDMRSVWGWEASE
ncbi:putative ARCA protein [Rosellinia necatrix]|uniref:Putative ARCA protein n=1 Tax=Rosellinia necatrix TaxID=77044 RepID=A0A1W2TS93_ROSNE|nr:putative ARCA protein [Rosellinia necatrix]